MVNFSSFRSVYETTMDTLNYSDTIKTLAIIAEGVPESQTREIIKAANEKNVRKIEGYWQRLGRGFRKVAVGAPHVMLQVTCRTPIGRLCSSVTMMSPYKAFALLAHHGEHSEST